MPDPRAKDALLVITACMALGALVFFAVAVVTGRVWWVAFAMTAFTALNAVLYFRERRRFRSDPGAGDPRL